MKIYHNAFLAGREHPNAVIAVGKFDGLHRGHRRVLRAAQERARAHKTSFLVLTFDPEPSQFTRLFSYRPLLPLAKRLEGLKRLGADAVVVLPFDKQLTCVSPEGFAKTVLAAQLRPLAVCVGEDFCFGKDRAGRVETLQDLGPELGFLVYPVPLLREGGEKITAERIRKLLDAGELAKAGALLGRPALSEPGPRTATRARRRPSR
jgi:riboflavin kinase/FMN adenylyltransferase